MGTPRWKKVYVEEIPIPRVDAETQRPLIGLVDRIIAEKDANWNADIAPLEEEINRLVYSLYGLNRTEIATVKRSP